MTTKKLTPGQTVCLVISSYRYNDPPAVHDATIDWVGRKCFTLAEFRGYTYGIGTLRRENGGGWGSHKVYLSREEYEQERELNALRTDARLFFGSWEKVNKLSLEQMRAIKAIIEEVKL